jgi:hypothetical protein
VDWRIIQHGNEGQVHHAALVQGDQESLLGALDGGPWRVASDHIVVQDSRLLGQARALVIVLQGHDQHGIRIVAEHHEVRHTPDRGAVRRGREGRFVDGAVGRHKAIVDAVKGPAGLLALHRRPTFVLGLEDAVGLVAQGDQGGQAAVALANHCGALRNQIERCEGQHKAQPCQSLGGTNQGGLQLKSVGFIVQKVLLDIEPYPILFEGRPIRRFIAEHIPDVVTLLRASHSQMQWTIALVGDEHPRPETGVPPRHRKALDLAARTPMTIEPKATLDPDTKVPAKPVQIAHQLRIGKAPIGQKDDLAVHRE